MQAGARIDLAAAKARVLADDDLTFEIAARRGSSAIRRTEGRIVEGVLPRRSLVERDPQPEVLPQLALQAARALTINCAEIRGLPDLYALPAKPLSAAFRAWSTPSLRRSSTLLKDIEQFAVAADTACGAQFHRTIVAEDKVMTVRKVRNSWRSRPSVGIC